MQWVPRGLSRRALLVGLGGGVAAATGFGVYRLLAEPDVELAPTPGVLRIGRRYLEAVPEEADLGILLARLPNGTDPERLAGRLSDLAPAVAEDFAQGRVVLLRGWLVSRTEARAAAVLALTAQP